MREPVVEGEREVLTVEEAAAYLQIHKATVYKYIRAGLLPAARLGKVYRLLRRDVDAFLETMKHEPFR
jgi:excisionase family DNA binding protein